SSPPMLLEDLGDQPRGAASALVSVSLSIGKEAGNKHLVPSLAVRGASQAGGAPCLVIQKSMNRPSGGSRLNKSGENLGKFIDSLNDCPGDYALLSQN